MVGRRQRLLVCDLLSVGRLLLQWQPKAYGCWLDPPYVVIGDCDFGTIGFRRFYRTTHVTAHRRPNRANRYIRQTDAAIAIVLAPSKRDAARRPNAPYIPMTVPESCAPKLPPRNPHSYP